MVTSMVMPSSDCSIASRLRASRLPPETIAWPGVASIRICVGAMMRWSERTACGGTCTSSRSGAKISYAGTPSSVTRTCSSLSRAMRR